MQVQGVSEEYLEFATFDAERGRMIRPIEIERKRPVALLGWGTADRLFGAPIRSTRQIRIAGVPFTVVGVSEKKGAVVRQVDGRVRGDSARRRTRSCSARGSRWR